MMGTHTLGVFLLGLLSLSSGVIVTDINCDYSKNEYYIPQGDLCKKCDKCPPAFGIETVKDMTIEVDPVHGAMGCRRCIHCQKGYYSKSRSYRECKVCRNCTLEGKVELRKCSDTSNAKCGGALPFLPLNTYDTPKAIEMHQETDSNVPSIKEYKSDNITVPILIVVGVVTAMCLLVLTMIFLHRTQQCRKQSVGHSNSLSRNDSSEKKPIIQPDGVNNICIDIEDDGKQDLYPLFDEWKIKNGADILLNSPHMLHLCKPLAPDNIFHKLGIKLGVPENEIAIIQTDYSGNVANQAYHTLVKYQHIMAGSATVVKVLNCLLELKRYDIVEGFCKKFP